MLRLWSLRIHMPVRRDYHGNWKGWLLQARAEPGAVCGMRCLWS